MSIPRVSYEKLALDRLRAELNELPGLQVHFGQGGGNRFGIPSWALPLNQQFQFGDLRIESSAATVVVEAESAGGVGNLVKYWPHLRNSELSNRFVLVHLFLIGSERDYISHRMLWEFLTERMRDDLEAQRGLLWPDNWEAILFTYRPNENLHQVSAYIASRL